MNRRLKLAIAQYAIGWTPILVEGKRPMWRTPDGRITGEREIPDYPSDIAAAWTVVEHFQQLCTQGQVELAGRFWKDLMPRNLHMCDGRVAAITICLAALRALGVPTPEKEE